MRGFLMLFIGVLVAAVVPAFAGPYANSAHGNASTGVRRLADSGLQGNPSTGSCSHCHDRKDSRVSGAAGNSSLFAANFNRNRQLGPYAAADLFCFQCHTAAGSLQQSALGMGDFDYSRNFGGLYGGPSDLLATFNLSTGVSAGSSHNLYDIWKYAQKFSSFDLESSPCSACHNPHRARNFSEHVTDPAYSSVSLVDDPESLWGDQLAETMANYSGNYQPPLYAGISGGYEPGGVARAFADGSQLPDYNQFCQKCHVDAIYSTSLQRKTRRIEWQVSGSDSPLAGDKHGVNRFSASLDVVAPYDDPVRQVSGYVLACSDCHEPHGSVNDRLIRRGVNGSALVATVSSRNNFTAMGALCRQCHRDDYHAGGGLDVQKINRWESVHHFGSDRPYPPGGEGQCSVCHVAGATWQPIACGYCHGHGSYVDVNTPGVLPNGKQIPAPEGGFRKTF